MGNPWIAQFDSSSSSSGSPRPSSPGAEKKEEDGTKRKKKSNFFMDPATDHSHSLSAFGRHLAPMGTRAWAYWTFITGERIKRKEKFFIQNGGFLLQQKISSCRTGSFKIFTAKELERATENYSVSRILGQGAKSDVYSFGVVLVELLTAEKPICLSRSQKDRSLAMHFISAMEENRLFQVLEDQVRNEGHETQLIAIAQLAKRCLKVKGEERPTMKEVALELQGLRGSQYRRWVNNNLEEAESLLGGASQDCTGEASEQNSLENRFFSTLEDGL
ncbi:hypothetical protein AAC387_Pa03g2183 [Persea americana]